MTAFKAPPGTTVLVDGIPFSVGPEGATLIGEPGNGRVAGLELSVEDALAQIGRCVAVLVQLRLGTMDPATYPEDRSQSMIGEAVAALVSAEMDRVKRAQGAWPRGDR